MDIIKYSSQNNTLKAIVTGPKNLPYSVNSIRKVVTKDSYFLNTYLANSVSDKKQLILLDCKVEPPPII